MSYKIIIKDSQVSDYVPHGLYPEAIEAGEKLGFKQLNDKLWNNT